MSVRVILLAAGRSLRMAPLADKNFLKFFGKPLIQHQIEALTTAGFMDILVIGGKHNLAALKELRTHLAGWLKKQKTVLEILEQKNLDLGMAGGVLTAKKVWKKDEPMLLASSNDIVEAGVFEKMFLWSQRAGKNLEGVLTAKKVDSYFPGGYLVLNRKGLVKEIVEKPKSGKEPSDLVNLVVHLHHKPDILFKYLEEERSRGGAKDDIYECALQNWLNDGARFRVEPYKGFWQPVKYPWHALSLMNGFLNKIENMHFPRGRIGGVKAKVAKTARLVGKNIYFGSGVRVMDNAVIQGPCYIGENTVIGTGSLVRCSHIGANCVIGYNSEVARSYIGDGCWFHTNYVGDSVIGDNVAFGSGTVTGNLRLDAETVKVSIEKTWDGKKSVEKVDTGLKKLGVIIGDDVRVGINASLMPGIKIGSGSFIGGGIVVGQDIAENSFARGDFKIKISANQRTISRRAL